MHISGKGEDSSKLYEMADHFVSTLRRQVFAKTKIRKSMTITTAITSWTKRPALCP